MVESSETKTEYFTGKDKFVKPDGSMYHLGTKPGQVHQRIITVGAAKRARAVASHFDAGSLTEIHSDREMHTFNGTYNGVPISIIAIGMGAPMMDFMVREATQCQEGPMAIIRLGTCGIMNDQVAPGTIMTGGKGSVYSYVNYGHFSGGYIGKGPTAGSEDCPPYFLCKPEPCSAPLNESLVENLKKLGLSTHDGLNACGETFYACQGRVDEMFEDNNQDVLATLKKSGVDWLEMETHQLFYLARVRKVKCHAAGCAIGLVNRWNTSFPNIDEAQLRDKEEKAGKACLEALSTMTL